MCTLTVFEISLFGCRSMLEPAQQFQGVKGLINRCSGTLGLNDKTYAYVYFMLPLSSNKPKVTVIQSMNTTVFKLKTVYVSKPFRGFVKIEYMEKSFGKNFFYKLILKKGTTPQLKVKS